MKLSIFAGTLLAAMWLAMWAFRVDAGRAALLEPNMKSRIELSRDQDVRKGATEDERPTDNGNAPALDDDGLPNDPTAIAQDALGANEDGSQG